MLNFTRKSLTRSAINLNHRLMAERPPQFKGHAAPRLFPVASKKRDALKLTIIGDTHMRHDELGTLKGDVLIHVGDMFDLFHRNADDLKRVDAWFAQQRFDLILCIAGNHDHVLEDRRRLPDQPFANAVYLEDRAIEHKGVTFYGSPWVPDLHDHAFYADGDLLREKWSGIPVETDVVITHTPPAGILDQSSRGQMLGCPDLAERIARIAPKIHCFGHVHASGGACRRDGTRYINASCLNKEAGPLRRPARIRV